VEQFHFYSDDYRNNRVCLLPELTGTAIIFSGFVLVQLPARLLTGPYKDLSGPVISRNPETEF